MHGRFITQWRGEIIKNKNHNADSIPNIQIHLREINNNGCLGKYHQKEVALMHLGLLSIGTVIENGKPIERKEYPSNQFNVSFNIDDYDIVTLHEEYKNSGKNLIPYKNYQLPSTLDESYLLKFHLPSGGFLLVPCIEFFLRCYGHSAEIKRVITTLPWNEAKLQLLKPTGSPRKKHIWDINISKRMHDNDGVFLAHACYDLHAENAIKSIYPQIESNYKNRKSSSYIKIHPWFKGNATLLVSGVHIPETKSFLALRILGLSDPTYGDLIVLDRENSNITAPSQQQLNSSSEINSHILRNEQQKNGAVTLVDNEEPNGGTSGVEINEEPLIKLGKARMVIKAYHTKQSTASSRHIMNPASRYSAGQCSGSGKGIGYASIHSSSTQNFNQNTTILSTGILLSIWNAALILKSTNNIQSVEWYTFKHGFQNNGTPILIPLSERSTGENKEKIKKWAFFDIDSNEIRGIQVLCIKCSHEISYVIEIQRKEINKTRNTQAIEKREQSFKGLIFKLKNQNDLNSTLDEILSEIEKNKRITKGMINKPGSTSSTFIHKEGDKNQPYVSTIKKALSFIGIII